MGDNQIFKGVMRGLGQLGAETGEKLVGETGKILESIITAQELLGDITPMSDQELAQKKKQEEIKKQQEIDKLKSEMGQGRKVEDEMNKIHSQTEKEEDEKEKYYEKLKQQQEAQKQQQESEYNSLMMESSNPTKQKKSRGSAFGHKKKSQPDQSQMSQTQEFKGKID